MPHINVATLVTFILFWPVLLVVAVIYRINLLFLFDALEYFSYSLQATIMTLLGYELIYPVHHSGTIVVSGANTLIGGKVVAELAERGYYVFAGVHILADANKLKNAASPEKRDFIIPVLLDPMNTSQIQNAVQKVNHTFTVIPSSHRQLVGIINCESTVLSSPLETTSTQEWSKIFNHNVFGPFAVIGAFLPLLRESRGRIINISHASGMTANPLKGVFFASHTALASATHTLRNEVHQFGVSVSLVIPGSIDETEMASYSVDSGKILHPLTQSEHELYSPVIKAVTSIEKEQYKYRKSASITSNVVVGALTSTMPRPRYLVGLDTKMTGWLEWMFSDRIMDWSFQLLIKRNDISGAKRKS